MPLKFEPFSLNIIVIAVSFSFIDKTISDAQGKNQTLKENKLHESSHENWSIQLELGDAISYAVEIYRRKSIQAAAAPNWTAK